MTSKIVISLVGLLCACTSVSAAFKIPPTLKRYDSPYYQLYTDVSTDEAREVALRVTKMAEEYHERTKGLFNGEIRERLPFYLFDKPQDYAAAGGMQNSGGAFIVDENGARLMAMVLRDKKGRFSDEMWHTIQHEGFHQFVYYVVQGEIPPWVNEGMAEYFGEGVFTGDSMITGLIPPGRCKTVKQGIAQKKFQTIQGIMYTSQAAWNSKLEATNYDQAWSMCHFLALGENGKYQSAFASFLQGIGRGMKWDQAWMSTFGDANGFEERWKTYWTNMPDDATKPLYAKAVVATLTSFLARASSQKQTFTSFDEFIKTDAASLKYNPADWLPPSLYGDVQPVAQRMLKLGYTFDLASEKGKLPVLTCVTPTGEKITGTFRYTGSGASQRATNVKTDLVKLPTKKVP